MKCAIYTRVSTDEQGTSIINQQEYFKDYIQRNNLEIHDIYSDEAFSGTESSKRLSFQRLLEDGKNKRYDILLAKSYSRFGRNQRETLTALAELFENGIRIIFVEDGLDSMRDKGQFGLFAWLAEQESRKLSERLKITWQLYDKEGKIHAPFAPFGYEYSISDKNFIIIPEEAEIVKLIFDMYLKGNGVRKIMLYLKENGYRTKKGGIWAAKTIGNILQNEAYTGSLIQGKYRTIDVSISKKEKINRKDWAIHKDNHESIISENDFFTVQELFKKRSQYVIDNKRSRYSTVHLFSNLLKCGMCGASLKSKLAKKKNYLVEYSCSRYEDNGVEVCGHRRNIVSEDLLIDLVKLELNQFSDNNFDSVKDYFKHDNDKTKKRSNTNDLKRIDKQIETKTNLSLKLLTAYTEGLVGDTQYKLQNEVLEKDMKALMSQRENIIAEQDKYVINTDNEKEMIDAIKELNNTNPKQWTNEMMKRIIERIEVNVREEYIHIFFKFSLPR